MNNIDKALKKMLGNSKSNSINTLPKNNNMFNMLGKTKTTNKSNNNILGNFGLKQFGGRNDLDFDGVINKKDCQPRNTMRQDSVYHVTHTKNISKIQKKGIKPLQTTNWERAGDKSRYGEGEIYAFENPQDAVRWGAKMDWEFNKDIGSGKISIVKAESDKKEWEVDKNDPLSQIERKGDWLKKEGAIYPKDIRQTIPLTSNITKRIRAGEDIDTSDLFTGAPIQKQPIISKRTPANYNDNVTINKFSTKGGSLDITEYKNNTGAVSSLYVDEDSRRKGIASNLLNEAKNKYKQVHAQVSNVPSVKTHFKAGFRLDDNKDATEEESIAAYEKASTGPGSVGMSYTKGAPIHKQQEWKQKTEVQKDIQRITKPDTDGDNVPNEYDCEPNNKDRQDSNWHQDDSVIANKIQRKDNYKKGNNERIPIGSLMGMLAAKKRAKEEQEDYYREQVASINLEYPEVPYKDKKEPKVIKPIIQETDFDKQTRKNRGYDKIITVDAKKLRAKIQADQGGNIAWDDRRLQSAREREKYSSYAQIDFNKDYGKLDVNDGGHRIAVAAERGQKIKVAINSKRGWEDNDRDGIINAEDCEPNNPDKQDSNLFFHGTTKKNYEKIKREGLKTTIVHEKELKRIKKNRNAIFLSKDVQDAKYYSKLGHATHAISESEKMERNEKNESEFDSFNVHKSFYSSDKPVVLKINVPKEKKQPVLYGTDTYYYRDNISPENIKVLNNKEQKYYNLLYKMNEQIEQHNYNKNWVNVLEQRTTNKENNKKYVEKYKKYAQKNYLEYEKLFNKTSELGQQLGLNEHLNYVLRVDNNFNNSTSGAPIQKQQEWKQKTEVQKDIQRITKEDTDGDNTPDEYDCVPDDPNRQDTQYHELTDEEYRRGVLQQPKNIKTYGEVSEVSGKRVGAGIVTAGLVVPGIIPAPITTPIGLGVAKYVDKVRVIKTDEHDNKYKIPRLEVVGKQK